MDASDRPTPRDDSDWDDDYRTGRWDQLGDLREVQRYSVIAGLVRHLAGRARVLDVGCGEGVLLHRLGQTFCRGYVGIDRSAVAIAHAERRVTRGRVGLFGILGRRPSVRFLHADVADAAEIRSALEASDIPGIRFDAIVLNEVLYYVPDPLLALRCFEELLEPDGVLVVSMNSIDAAFRAWEAIEPAYRTVDETRLINSATGLEWIVRSFRKAGGAGTTDGHVRVTRRPTLGLERIARRLVRRSRLARALLSRLPPPVAPGPVALIDKVNGTPITPTGPLDVFSDLLGHVTIEGWAADELTRTRAGSVHVEVDGYPHPVQRGLPREDIARLLDEPAFAYSGFGLTVPVPPGPHRLVVAAQDLAGERRTRSQPILVRVREPELAILVEEVSGSAIDRPGEVTVRSDLSGKVRVRGWAVDVARQRPAGTVEAQVDGCSYAARLGLRRDDVARGHRQPRYLHSGFELELPLPDGRQRLRLLARGEGAEERVASVEIALRVIDPRRCDLARRLREERARVLRRRHAPRIEALSEKPLISVLTPVHEPEAVWLTTAIESVLCQTYPFWELCLVDDASRAQHVREILAAYASRDARIRTSFHTEHRHISEASNTALGLASGEFVALLDHDDELTPDALLEVAEALSSDPQADLVYSDECVVGPEGNVLENMAKPGWSPDTLLCDMYMGHLCVVRRRLVEAIGGFRKGFEGAQDYDLVLRAVSAGARIAHVRKTLYRWRAVSTSVAGGGEKPYADAAAKRALHEHLRRQGVDASLEAGLLPHTYRARPRLVDPPGVAIVLSTRFAREQLQSVVAGLRSRTTYARFQIYLAHDPALGLFDSSSWTTQAPERSQILTCPADILTAQVLQGVAEELVLLLDRALRPARGDWLEALVEPTRVPGIGAVGARLPFGDGPLSWEGRTLFERTLHNADRVSSACLLTPRWLLSSYGRARLAETMRPEEDAAYCSQLRAWGYRIVYTPYAELLRSPLR